MRSIYEYINIQSTKHLLWDRIALKVNQYQWVTMVHLVTPILILNFVYCRWFVHTFHQFLNQCIVMLGKPLHICNSTLKLISFISNFIHFFSSFIKILFFCPLHWWRWAMIAYEARTRRWSAASRVRGPPDTQTSTTTVRRSVRCIRRHRTRLDAGSARLDAAHQVDMCRLIIVRAPPPIRTHRTANIKRREGRKEKRQKNRLMFEESH